MSVSFAVLVLFYSLTLPLIAVVFPAGSSLASLDDPVFYSAREVIDVVDGWGDGGRRYQFWFHLTWDSVAPALSFLFLGFGLSWLFQRAFERESRWRRLNLLALVPVFDILENACLIWLIVDHPTRAVGLAGMKTVLTVFKYSCLLPLVLATGVGLILAMKKEFRLP